MNVKLVYLSIAFSVSFSPLSVLLSFYEYKVLDLTFPAIILSTRRVFRAN